MISIIVATDSKRGIGKNNGLMWHISSELKRFKAITSGHPIIMGRKTYESIGRPLPNRTNIVITRNASIIPDLIGNLDPRLRGDDKKSEDDKNLIIVNSLDEALGKAKVAPGAEEIFVIGGAQIYAQSLPIVDRLYLTIVEGDFGADVFFPDYSEFKKMVSEEQKEEGEYRYKLLILEKIS